VTRTQAVDKNLSPDELKNIVTSGHVYNMPFEINQYVYMITGTRALRVVVTDIGVGSIQLNGQWYTWEELEEKGGAFEAEFDALTAIAQMGI